jgi:nitroimidazol reductase NimA-like FMN-containing flavoprotein (pyridoxamine 5'-phosphate oxidase superfamily)
MPKMSDHEIDEYLDETGHMVRIGTVDVDGHPRVVPTWYIRQGEDILFTPRAPAVFLANIRRDPRIGLSIDEDPLPYRKITVQGLARIVREPGEDDEWRDLYRQIVYRYVEREAGDSYVNDTIDQPRALIAVSLSDSKVTTWRMPLEGEDGTGIWARRYYGENTHMASLIESGTARDVDYMPESS